MQYNVDIITHYFPDLTIAQVKQFEQLYDLYIHWNEMINVVSRKDINELYLRHVLHSLGIAKVISFKSKTKILDVGTGGGFPGIPLAILFPQCEFVLVDSIGKKIKVVNEVTKELGLKNIEAVHKRAEEVEGKFDFIVTRAVTRLNKFLPWVKGKINFESKHPLKNGILFLKGGNLTDEILESGKKTTIFPLHHFFEEDFFETKVVLHVEG